MPMIERQSQSVAPGIGQAPVSTVRLDGFEHAGKEARLVRAGGDTLRHVRDVLADFLQYDAKG